MAEQSLKGFRVAILATDLFEQAELTEPKKALQDAGADVKVLAPKEGEIQGVKHDQKADKVKVDGTIADAKPSEYDAVMLPGGAMNADALRMDQDAQEFVQQMERNKKPIAVICHGPWLLISAGLVKGHKMTSYHTIQDDLKNAGAQWQDSECIVDGSWVSSRQPDDIPRFNQEMIRIFAEYRDRNKKAA